MKNHLIDDLNWNNFFSGDEPFLSEPNPQPYYVREGEPGPLLNCKFDQKYIKQGQYERDWTRIVNGVPKFVFFNFDSCFILFFFFRLLARDDVVFSKDDYKLVIDESSGDYSLQIKKVQFDRDNGQFFCRLLDQTTGNQINSKPATIWVVGKSTFFFMIIKKSHKNPVNFPHN